MNEPQKSIWIVLRGTYAVFKPIVVTLTGIYNTLASTPEFAAILRGKLATVVVDRRFWIAAFTVLGMVFGVPQLVDQADGMGNDVADTVQIIIQSVGSLVSVLALIVSWTKRAPSGKEFNELDRLASYIKTRYGEDVL